MSEAVVLSSGREGRTKWQHRVLCPVFLLQWCFQNYLAESHPAKACLKICIYSWETHFPRVASGYAQKKTQEFFRCFYNVSNIKSTVSVKSKTPLPCTRGRILQVQDLCVGNSPCKYLPPTGCTLQGFSTASAGRRVPLCLPAQPRGFTCRAVFRAAAPVQRFCLLP